MHFTLFSILLILAVGAGIFVETRRGLGRGLVRSAVTLCSVLVSALLAILSAAWLSNTPANMFSEILNALIPTLETLADAFPHTNDIVVAAVDALITPVFFVAFFILIRLVLRIVIAAFFRARWKYAPDDPRHAGTAARPAPLTTPNYEPADAPWHRRHDRLLGGITGGFCGFLASLLLLSPVLGTLSVAGTLLGSLDSMNVDLNKTGISSDVLAQADAYVYDGTAAVLNAMGGELIYDAISVTTLNGQPISLRRELETCMDVGADFLDTVKVVREPVTLSAKKKATIQGLGDQINESEVTRLLAADFLNGAGTAWHNGEKYLGIPRPVFGEVLDPLVDKALLVCMETTPDCAGRDITTILNIYLIAVESGLTDNPDREQLIATLDEGGVLDLIYAELKKNPCMAHLCDELSDTALRIMASAIDWADFSPDVYRDLMDNLSEAMNLVNGMEGATFAEQVESMTQYTMHYAQQYGFEIPESMAKMAATAMVEQLSDSGKLDADALDEFFNYYLNGN